MFSEALRNHPSKPPAQVCLWSCPQFVSLLSSGSPRIIAVASAAALLAVVGARLAAVPLRGLGGFTLVSLRPAPCRVPLVPQFSFARLIWCCYIEIIMGRWSSTPVHAAAFLLVVLRIRSLINNIYELIVVSLPFYSRK